MAVERPGPRLGPQVQPYPVRITLLLADESGLGYCLGAVVCGQGYEMLGDFILVILLTLSLCITVYCVLWYTHTHGARVHSARTHFCAGGGRQVERHGGRDGEDVHQLAAAGPRPAGAAVDETVKFCCTPHQPLAGVSIAMERERQQNDRTLANGYRQELVQGQLRRVLGNPNISPAVFEVASKALEEPVSAETELLESCSRPCSRSSSRSSSLMQLTADC